MICSKYEALSLPEKFELTGRVIHALMNSDKYFTVLCDAINDAEKEGLFEGIIVNPQMSKEQIDLLPEYKTNPNKINY